MSKHRRSTCAFRMGAALVMALSAAAAASAQSSQVFVDFSDHGIRRPPQPFSGPDAADPTVPVPGVHYRSTIGSYHRRRPVEPGDWSKQNESANPRSAR
jgi:hypothetical protein